MSLSHHTTIIGRYGNPHTLGADWSVYTWTVGRNGAVTIRIHDTETTVPVDGEEMCQPLYDVAEWRIIAGEDVQGDVLFTGTAQESLAYLDGLT